MCSASRSSRSSIRTSNPQGIAFPVPGNDDASRAIRLYCDAIANAAIAGKTGRRRGPRRGHRRDGRAAGRSRAAKLKRSPLRSPSEVGAACRAWLRLRPGPSRGFDI